MQPPTPSASDSRAKKRKNDNKKTTKPIENDESKAEPVILSETRSPGPYRGKCLYQSRKCENERAIKRNGKPHNLCEEHRSKQNQHQRKFDAKKFSRKRRRGSVSDEDVKPVEEPRAKLQRSETPTNPLISTVPTMRGYYTAGHAPVPRLPPIQSPRGPILPPSPAVLVYTRPEAYPRSHVVSPLSQRSCLPVSQGYSQSELVAVSILAQPESLSTAMGTPQSRAPNLSTPVLPSLLVPPSAALSSSPYHRVNGSVPSPAQRFAPVVTPPRVGTVLPPLVPFGLRRTPTPPPIPKPL